VGRKAAALATLCPLALAACGSGGSRQLRELVPPRFGPAPQYRPAALSPAVAAARPVAGGLRCSKAERPRKGAHLEVFVNRMDVVIPAGIGVTPPHRRQGAYVLGGSCSYPLRTTDPTGMIEIDRGRGLTLGQFFAAWGQPLGPRRLLGFSARGGDRVAVFVNGRRFPGDPRRVPLTRHAALMVELGGYVPPRLSYGFPPDL
jgi:hypothetical protein